MSMTKFAGIAKPYEIGSYDVATNATVLQRYRFMHEGLLRVAAGQLPARENWDLKLALCKHLNEDAEAATALRQRIPQLRTSSTVLHKEPDPILTLLMEELIQARTDLELAAGIYSVVKPALLDVYRRHADATQQIVDQPTIRILRSIMLDLEDQIRFGQEMRRELERDSRYPDPGEFAEKLQSYLAAAGGIDGLSPKSPDLPRRWRSHETYRLPARSARDPVRMGPAVHGRTSVANPPADPVRAKLAAMMRVRQEEMTACELVAGVLYAQKNMPWEFYSDLARHIWDEARHAMFGQAALEADGYEWMSRPQFTSDYDLNAPKLPSVQYVWLSIGIEERAMVGKGKMKEYEFCRDEAGHPLMTQFQDYDWADEIVHAGFGRKWTPDMIGDDIHFAREIAQRELKEFFEVYHSETERLKALY